MMLLAVLLFIFGLVMSAFFSGSETGMYRVSRTRLVLDGLDGSRKAQAMIWLLNHPTVFVSTALVGNNLANFCTSFAIVLGIEALFGVSTWAELIGPVLMTPFVFVFGELLPKHWFFQAPYRLLMFVRPLMFLCTILFLPVSLFLVVLSYGLQLITGQTPFRLRLAMARGELAQVLRAGEEAGILEASQRSLAGQLFEVGNLPAVSFAVPFDRLPMVDLPLDSGAIDTAVRRQNHPIVLVCRESRIVGYLRYSEWVMRNSEVEIRPVVRVPMTERHLTTLLKLYDARSEVVLLCDDRDEAKLVVTRRQLTQPLLK